MNARQKKKHWLSFGFENGHKPTIRIHLHRHYFLTHKPKSKRYSVHYLRELYKHNQYAYNFKELD